MICERVTQLIVTRIVPQYVFTKKKTQNSCEKGVILHSLIILYIYWSTNSVLVPFLFVFYILQNNSRSFSLQTILQCCITDSQVEECRTLEEYFGVCLERNHLILHRDKIKGLMFNFKEKSTIIKPLSSWNRMLMSGRSPHLNVHFNNELNWKTNGEGKFKKKKMVMSGLHFM